MSIPGVENGKITLPLGGRRVPVAIDDLLLLELRHVSAGSWQPVIAVRDSAYM